MDLLLIDSEHVLGGRDIHDHPAILTFLIVHTGEMEDVFLEANDAVHYIPEWWNSWS